MHIVVQRVIQTLILFLYENPKNKLNHLIQLLTNSSDVQHATENVSDKANLLADIICVSACDVNEYLKYLQSQFDIQFFFINSLNS